MSIIIRHTIKEPVIYSVSGTNAESRIMELSSEYKHKKILIIESETTLTSDAIVTLNPDVVLCNDFKPSRSFIKKCRRK